jgi:hypothetical protein
MTSQAKRRVREKQRERYLCDMVQNCCLLWYAMCLFFCLLFVLFSILKLFQKHIMPPTRKVRGRGAVIPVVRGLEVATRRTAAQRGRRPAPAGRTVSGQREDLAYRSESMQKVFPESPLLAYRRDRNICDVLVHTKTNSKSHVL